MAQINKVVVANGGTRWRIRVHLGRDPETKKRTIITRTFDRKKDAEAEATRLERQKDLGALTAPSKETLARYLGRWLDNVKEGRIRARTLYDYRGIIKRYIQAPPAGAPPIGSIRLDRLTPAAFEALYAFYWKEAGLAPRTIQYLHTILRQALNHAVKTGALPRNPTDAVKPYEQAVEDQERPRKEKVMRAMSKDEAARFLIAAREDRLSALWHVLLLGGLRPGEALALVWEDADLDGGKVHIRRSLTRTGIEGWRLTEPKTDRARRVVVLPPVAIRALREHRRKQAEERLSVGAEYAGHGFVFATAFGQPLEMTNLSSRSFRRVMAAAELGSWEGKGKGRRFRPAFRMYDLRHTAATLLLLAGENPKVVSERLGHASITLTLDTYSHVLPAMQEASAEKLEIMFGGT